MPPRKVAKRNPKPCAIPGCGKLTQKKHCERHTKKANWQFKKKRKSASSRMYNRKWQKAREVHLWSNPLCVHCNKMGIVRLADEVDHIVPHRGDPELFWDEDNWQSLCKPHHDKKTASGL